MKGLILKNHKLRLEAINVPLYDYECFSCGKRFEVFISMNDTQKKCLYCESENINKIVPNAGIKINKNDFKTKTGDVVKKHIEESKKDLRKEKKKLKETYK